MATFLQKYEELKKSIPVPAVRVTQTEDCQMVDYTHFSKNCYQTFTVMSSENVMYSFLSVGRDLVDCTLCIFSNLCYECLESGNCYAGTYLINCNNCQNCHFCSICIGCSDCFGCVALTHKKYCIFNKQYSKQEYEKQLTILKKASVETNFKKLLALVKKIPQPQNRQNKTLNCPYGDFIDNSKNSYWIFNGVYVEDSGYLYNCGTAKNCWDMTFSGGGGSGTQNVTAITDQLNYEIIGGANNYSCAFSSHINNCTNCYYSSDCRNCTDCFGCVGLTNKKYCILNNQLTKEKYFETVALIKNELGWKV
jgi:hypothetical protein